ncbi:ubiquitin carboxyl-terminal hydrolase 8, partial [Plakobranchus ocellatus]
LEKAKREEAEKKRRLAEVEKMRQERKKAELEKEKEKRLEEDAEEERQWKVTQEALRREKQEEEEHMAKLQLEQEREVAKQEEERKAAEKLEETRRLEKEQQERVAKAEAERQKEEAARQARELERQAKEAEELARQQKLQQEAAQAEAERKRKEQMALDMEQKQKQKKAEEEASLRAASKPNVSWKPVPSNLLPPGWEKRLDQTTNRYYYIDHNRGITQWNSPALPNPDKLKEQSFEKVHQPLSIFFFTPSRSSNLAAKQTAHSLRKRDLNPVYGDVGPALTGLRNLGNTCYMNSTIQCLNNASPLVSYILNDDYVHDINRQRATAYFQVYVAGQLKSSLKCGTCMKTSVTFQAFMFLSLPIPASSKCSLQDCIRAFLKPEMMTGSSKWKCPRCKVERDSEKKIEIWKLPPILLVGLNRFYSEGMWMQKKSTYVDFPVNDLDLSQYIIGPPPRNKYSLYGISNHYGTMEGGHYTAFCRNPVNKKWHKFDDQDVYEISPSDVKTSAAFVLYYSSIEMKGPKYVPRL